METATGKSGFLLYHDQRAFFCLLNDAEAKALILAVFDYETMRTEPGPISPAADMAFVAIRQTLDRNRVKHDAIVERRREYGRLGGQAKASLSQHKLAKPSKASYTDTDSVTVTDTVTDRLEGIPSAGVPEKKPAKPTVDLPFASDSFAAVWSQYLEHRTRIRKPMTPYAQKLALAKLPPVEETAARWINNAIEKGWQGIYNPDSGPGSKAKNAEHSSTIWIDQSENRRKVDF